ncbi:MAG: SDR family NAD(P)-dependent oxidoreductase [Desulfobacterales bacterium]
MKLPFKSALVTGGAGFIGSHLVEALISAGCRVAVLDNLSTGSLTNLKRLKGKFSFFQDDIRNQKALSAAVEDCQVIFHLAAVVSVPQTVENPIESAAVNEMGSLAVQKLAAEYYAQMFYDLHGLETTVLRYFNVYGPRQDPSSPYSGVISIFMTKALLNEPAVIYGDGKQSRDFIFVQDVVRANLLAATARGIGGRIINIGSGKSVAINQLWDEICAVSDRNLEPEYAPKRPGDIVASLADAGRARELLDFECETSFEAGLKSTFDWYRSQRSEDG